MPVSEVPYNSFFFQWEIMLEEWAQANLPGGVIRVISWLSMFGEELVMIAVLGFLYWGWNKKLGRRVGLNIIMTLIITPMIKNIFIRRRPYFESEGIDLLRKIEPDADTYDIVAQGYSFPSGHSAGSVATYGSLAVYGTEPEYGLIRSHRIRKIVQGILMAAAVALPLLVGLSRVVVGAHYPTDVLTGWALGLLVIFLVPWLEDRINNRWIFYIILLVVSAAGFFYCTSTDYFTCFGMLVGFVLAEAFEQKYVRFENTRNLVRCILRVLGGAAIYLALNKLLKLPFSGEFLESATMAAFLVRTVRYAVVIFVDLGVYPMLFRVTAEIGKKKAA